MFKPRTIKGLSILSASISGMVILALGAAAIVISHHEMDVLVDYHAANGPPSLARLAHMRDGGAANGTGYLAGVGRDGRLMLYVLADC